MNKMTMVTEKESLNSWILNFYDMRTAELWLELYIAQRNFEAGKRVDNIRNYELKEINGENVEEEIKKNCEPHHGETRVDKIINTLARNSYNGKLSILYGPPQGDFPIPNLYMQKIKELTYKGPSKLTLEEYKQLFPYESFPKIK